MQLRPKFVGIGEVLWDFYRDERFIGGAPANFAIHAQQLGCDGILVSRVGRDGLGDELERTLSERGLNVLHLQRDSRKGTGAVFISLDIRGNPQFRCSEDVAFDYLDDAPEMHTLAEEADLILVSTIGQRRKEARQTVQHFLDSTKATRYYDLNFGGASREMLEIVAETLKRSDIARMNEHEFLTLKRHLGGEELDSGAFAANLIRRFKLKLLIVTRAEEGVTAFTPRKRYSQPAQRIDVADSTGAGDGFNAAFLKAWHDGHNIDTCLKLGNQVAAFICTQKGATPEFPASLIESFPQKS